MRKQGVIGLSVSGRSPFGWPRPRVATGGGFLLTMAPSTRFDVGMRPASVKAYGSSVLAVTRVFAVIPAPKYLSVLTCSMHSSVFYVLQSTLRMSNIPASVQTDGDLLASGRASMRRKSVP